METLFQPPKTDTRNWIGAVGRLYAEMTGYWGDEWMWLHQLEEAADHDWLRVNHPDVYARLRTSAIPT